MYKEIVQYLKFDAYLNGELSEKEVLAFEEGLANSSKLKREFELYKEVSLSLTINTPSEQIKYKVNKLEKGVKDQEEALFDLYQKDKLSPKERVLFHNRINADLLFKYKLEQYKRENPLTVKSISKPQPSIFDSFIQSIATLFRRPATQWAIAGVFIFGLAVFNSNSIGSYVGYGDQNSVIVSNEFDVLPKAPINSNFQQLSHEEEDLFQIRMDGLTAYNEGIADSDFSKRHLNKAIERLQLYMKKAPADMNNLSLYIFLGRSFYNLNDYDQAIVQYEKGIELITTFGQAYNNPQKRMLDDLHFQLGLAYSKKGNCQKVKILFDDLAQNAKDETVRNKAFKITNKISCNE